MKKELLEKLTDDEIELLMAELELREARAERERLAKEAEPLIYIAHLENKVKELEDKDTKEKEKALRKMARENKMREVEEKGKEAWGSFKRKLPKIKVEWGEKND